MLESASRTVIENALKSGKAVVERNLPAHPEYRGAQSVVRHGVLSVLCIPIFITDSESAVIYMDHRLLDGMFCEVEARMVEAFANLAGQALRNMRAWEEVEEHRQRNLKLQARRQALLLPSQEAGQRLGDGWTGDLVCVVMGHGILRIFSAVLVPQDSCFRSRPLNRCPPRP